MTPHIHPRPFARALLFVLAAAGALASIPGCNIIGPAYLLLHGPEKVKKVYTLEKDRSTVIFIDDRRNVLPRRSLRQIMAEQAQKTLLAEGALVNVIDCRAALAATARDKSTEPMKITDIARAVKADVVLYATVDQFVLSTDGQTFAPQISVRVKVVDAVNESRSWPDEKAGYTLTTALPTKQGFAPTSAGEVAQAEAETAQVAGLALAQLFVDHEVRETAIRAPEK